MIRYSAIVEGYGDVAAVPTLLAKIGAHFDIPVIAPKPIRAGEWKSLKQAGELERFLELAASKVPDRIILIQDLEDHCPAEEAQHIDERISLWKGGRDLTVDYCFLLREYETMFLHDPNCLGEHDSAKLPASPDNIRGAKEAIRPLIGRRYKETQDQLEFTRNIDLTRLVHASRSVRKLCKSVYGSYGFLA